MILKSKLYPRVQCCSSTVSLGGSGRPKINDTRTVGIYNLPRNLTTNSALRRFLPDFCRSTNVVNPVRLWLSS